MSKRKSWAEQVLLLEELKPEEKFVPEGLTCAEEVFFLEELFPPKPVLKPVILPQKIVAKLRKPVVVRAREELIRPIVIPAVPTVIALEPELTLAVDKAEGYVDDVFTFSGQLTNLPPEEGRRVMLYRDEFQVGSSFTDLYGEYTIPWTADVIGFQEFYTKVVTAERQLPKQLFKQPLQEKRKHWAEILLLEELKSEEKFVPAGLTCAEEVFFLEELTRPERELKKPVILPRKLVARLRKPVVVRERPIFPVILPAIVKPKPMLPRVVVLADELTLTVDKSEGYVDDVFSFSGTLIRKAGKKRGFLVTLFRNGVSVGSGTTDAHGDYVIPWTGDVIGAYEFHTETTV